MDMAIAATWRMVLKRIVLGGCMGLVVLQGAGFAYLLSAIPAKKASISHLAAAILMVGLVSLMLLMTGCLVAIEKRRFRPLAIAGLMLSAAASVVLLLNVLQWMGPRVLPYSVLPMQLDQASLILILLSAVVCLSVIAMIPRFRWLGVGLQSLTIASVLLTAATVAISLWGPGDPVRGGWDRTAMDLAFAGVFASLALLAVIFFVDRFARAGDGRRADQVNGWVRLHCPRCQAERTLPSGDSHCRQCRMTFHITLGEPRCGGCGYLLRGLTSAVCPECGMAVPRADMPAGGGAIAASGSAAATATGQG